MARAPRPCLTCGTPTTRRPVARCTPCEQTYQAKRNASRPQYSGDWDRQAKATVNTYREQHGDICPGWNRAPHTIDPKNWCCDHDVGPLCRRCNGSKAATFDKQRKQAQQGRG